jgi:hypothetical protein
MIAGLCSRFANSDGIDDGNVQTARIKNALNHQG